MGSKKRKKPRNPPPIKRKRKRKRKSIGADDQYFLLCGSGITIGLVVICFIWWSEKHYGNFYQLSNLLKNEVMVGTARPKSEQEGYNVIMSGTFKLVGKLQDPYLKASNHLFLERHEELINERRKRKGKKNIIRKYPIFHDKILFGTFRGRDVYKTLIKTYLKDSLAIKDEMLRDRLPVIGNKLRVRTSSGQQKKISYQYIPMQTFTIVAHQENGRLSPMPLLADWDNKYLIMPGKRSLSQVSHHFIRKNRFYSYIFRVYGLGLMWFAFCLFFIPFQGNFKSWSFLSSYTRILPLLFAIPTTVMAIASSNSNPSIRSLAFQAGGFFFFLLYFIAQNRSLGTEKREAIDFYARN